MLKFTVEAEPSIGLTDTGWMLNHHIPAQFKKAMRLVKRERERFGRPFDPDLLESLTGRVHIKLHYTDWEYTPGLWVAGVYLISGGPQTSDDGANFVDLIEASWTHEANLGWDTLEHEFAHFIQFRHGGNPATYDTDWTNMGHGTKEDPYLQAINADILDGYPITQPYFPGLLPSTNTRMSMMSKKDEGKVFRGCVTEIKK